MILVNEFLNVLRFVVSTPSPQWENPVRKKIWQCNSALFQTVYLPKNYELKGHVKGIVPGYVTIYIKEGQQYTLYSVPRDVLRRLPDIRENNVDYRNVSTDSENYYQLFSDNELFDKLSPQIIQQWVDEGKFDTQRWERIRDDCFRFQRNKIENERRANDEFLTENAHASLSELLKKKAIQELIELFPVEALKGMFIIEFSTKASFEILQKLPPDVFANDQGRKIVDYERFLSLQQIEIKRGETTEVWSFSHNWFSFKSEKRSMSACW